MPKGAEGCKLGLKITAAKARQVDALQFGSRFKNMGKSQCPRLLDKCGMSTGEKGSIEGLRRVPFVIII